MIKTQRCHIKRLEAKDFMFFQKLKTCSSVRKYLGGIGDIKEIETKFEKLLRSKELHVIVFENKTKEALGIIYINTYHDGVNQELSYEFIDSSWGKGYAYESISEVINYAQNHLQITALVAETQSKNEASIRLLEKLGFLYHEEIVRHGEKQKVYKYKV